MDRKACVVRTQERIMKRRAIQAKETTLCVDVDRIMVVLRSFATMMIDRDVQRDKGQDCLRAMSAILPERFNDVCVIH